MIRTVRENMNTNINTRPLAITTHPQLGTQNRAREKERTDVKPFESKLFYFKKQVWLLRVVVCWHWFFFTSIESDQTNWIILINRFQRSSPVIHDLIFFLFRWYQIRNCSLLNYKYSQIGVSCLLCIYIFDFVWQFSFTLGLQTAVLRRLFSHLIAV